MPVRYRMTQLTDVITRMRRSQMLKSMGEANFCTPTPPKPLYRFRCHVKYITTSRQGVDVQNLVGIDSAVTYFCVDFLLTYLFVYLSVRFFVAATGHTFVAILTLNGSNDVISQPLVPFGGHINIAPY